MPLMLIQRRRRKLLLLLFQRKRGKAEHIITKEQLDEAFEAIDKEEHEPKKKKAPLQIMSSMVEVTPAMKRMAKECADDFKANKLDLKAQYELERDEKLKSLGLEDCDRYYKEKLAEVRIVAGKAAEDDAEEGMIIFVEKAPEAEASEAVQVAQGENQGTTEVDVLGSATAEADNFIKVLQIPNPSRPVSPSSSQPPSSSQTPAPEQVENISVLENLVNHYSGELPKENLNSDQAPETASEAVASDKVVSDSP
jgi:hypothetical protein